MHNKQFKCIYCLKEPLKIKISESHIIPDTLGGMLILKNAVCETCNNKINAECEAPVKDAFVVIRQLLMIKSRKRKLPAVEAIASFRELECKIRVSNMAKLENEMLIFASKDKKTIACFATDEKLTAFQRAYEKKRPNVKWQTPQCPDKIGFKSPIYFDVCWQEAGLRLAAKAAFEWLCYKRSRSFVIDKEYDTIREYILNGTNKHNERIVSIVTDEQILSSLNNVPFGIHSIVITPTTDRTQAAIVGLFGIIYYKVILTKHYRLLTLEQQMVLLNPQMNVEYEPRFQMKFLRIKGYDREHFTDPRAAMAKIYDGIMQKMNRDVKRIIAEQKK